MRMLDRVQMRGEPRQASAEGADSKPEPPPATGLFSECSILFVPSALVFMG